MNADDYARQFQADLYADNATSVRAQATEHGEIGASSFGCREHMRMVLAGVPATDDPPNWAAFVGTALDDKMQAVRAKAHPDLLFKLELPVTLKTRQGEYTFNLHPDEVNPAEPSVTNYKTKAGLNAVRKELTPGEYRIQRHLEGLAAVQNGLTPAQGLQVRNVYVDRSGKDHSVHVEQEVLNEGVVAEAMSFLSDVLYAVKHNERASQDKPRTFCAAFCDRFTACRGGEIDYVPIFHPLQRAMVEAYFEASETEKAAKGLKDEVKPYLLELTGDTPEGYRITNTTINKVSGPVHMTKVIKLPGKEADK